MARNYVWQVDSFNGCDYSLPSLNKSENRASEESNYIRRDNCLQKRFGVKQVGSFALSSTATIHNIFSFIDKSGKERLIANVGGSLYEVDKTNFSFTLLDGTKGNNAVLDRKVCAFPTNNKLYILGGKQYLVCYLDEASDTLKLSAITNSDFAYKPTTTIGITPQDYEGSGHRTSLDKSNLLTYWRKNVFITGTHRDKEDNSMITEVMQEFKLDASISYRELSDLNNIEIDIEFYDTQTTQFDSGSGSSIKNAKFNVAFCKGLNLNGLDDSHTTDELVQDKDLGGIYILVHYGEGDFNASFIETIKDKILSLNSSIGDEQGFKVYGYINISGGSVVLFNDYENPSLEGNATIYFPSYNEDNYLTCPIDTCFIGIVYNSHNMNSLFCAGNPKFKNRDWHSEQISGSLLSEEELTRISEKDLVYFPDTSYCDYGFNSENPILGYDVLSTGDLLVMKRYQTYEPTIYFRQGTLTTKTDDYGSTTSDMMGTSLVELNYPTQVGNVGYSLNDYMNIDNFNGDTVFISNKNTIEHLTRESEITDNKKYSESVSVYIDLYLKDKDLSKAFLFENSEFLYFVLGDEIFATKRDENYEWYHLKLPYSITSMFNLNNEIYFADNNARLFKLENENTFYDETFINVASGDVLLKANTNQATISKDLISSIFVGDILTSDNFIKVKVGEDAIDFNVDISSLKVTFTNLELFNKLPSNSCFSFNNVYYQGTKESYGAFSLKQIDEPVSLDEGDPLYLIIKEMKVSSVDYNNQTITLDTFAFENDVSLTGKFLHRINVTSSYTTRPIIFNSTFRMYFKNIDAITIINDTPNESATRLKVVDNRYSKTNTRTYGLDADGKGINFSDINFEYLDLNKYPVEMRYKRITTRLMNRDYLVLNFTSDNDKNSVLSKMIINYSLGNTIRVGGYR